MSTKELWRLYLARTNPRPLCGFLWEPDVKTVRSIVERVGIGNQLKPEDILVEDLWAHVEEVLELNSGWSSDFPQAISACLGVPWLEAMIGCPIMVGQDTIWAEPSARDYDHLLELRIEPDNRWLKRLFVLHKELARLADQHFFPVCLPLMRGPLDLLSAIRGPAQLCLDLYDRPRQVKEAVGRLSQLWLRSLGY